MMAVARSCQRVYLRRSVFLACCALLGLGATALAQEKKDENQVPDPSKTNISHSSFEGKDITETNVFNKKGDLIQKTTETVSNEGKVTQTEHFKDGKIAWMERKETDAMTGKTIMEQFETYKDGVLVKGTIDGPGIRKVFNPDTGTYEDWKPVKPSSPVPKSEAPTPTPKTTTMVLPKEQPNLARLVSTDRVRIHTAGTGETIGHAADLKLQNQTEEPIAFVIPAMVLESKSRKNQDYATLGENKVTLGPQETKTVPIDGICVARNKPPAGKGVSDDLMVNTGDPTVARNPDSHLSAKQARDLVRLVESKYEAADKLQGDGSLKDLPYHDKQKQKDICVQWSSGAIRAFPRSPARRRPRKTT